MLNLMVDACNSCAGGGRKLLTGGPWALLASYQVLLEFRASETTCLKKKWYEAFSLASTYTHMHREQRLPREGARLGERSKGREESGCDCTQAGVLSGSEEQPRLPEDGEAGQALPPPLVSAF